MPTKANKASKASKTADGQAGKPHFVEWPIWDKDDENAIMDVLKSGKWWCGAPKLHAGENVWKLQEEFAKANESRYCFAVTNGTHAIEIPLLAFGIGFGDEVIVPEMTFVASASAVLATNAVPIFCDIDPETFNIDANNVEALITPRTKAIIAVHLGGMPCEMDKICEIAKKHKLRVIEDCAHGHLSRYKGKNTGNWGDCGTYSFQASKVLTCGEGGAIVCNDQKLADAIYGVADAGRQAGEWFYSHFSYGSNFRLGEFQAALLRTQLKKYPAQLKKRNEAAQFLNSELAKIPGVHPQKRNADVETCANYVYSVYYEPEKFGGIEYRTIYKELNDAGIPTDAFYPQLDQLGLFKNAKLLKGIDYSKANWGPGKSIPGAFPVVEKVSKSMFEFPQELLLSDQSDLQYVVDTVKNIQKKHTK